MEKLYQKFNAHYKNAWEDIVKPHRMTYSEYSLGPVEIETPKGNLVIRQDFVIFNKQNEKLEVSLFQTEKPNGEYKKKPCLIYLHSHSGSRIESLEIFEHASDYFSFCTFDFSGSGNSEGEFVTLGLKEQSDLDFVKNHLQKNFGIKIFYLWGRSMGAVTAILYTHSKGNKSCHGMVLDSPFTSVKEMVIFTYK